MIQIHILVLKKKTKNKKGCFLSHLLSECEDERIIFTFFYAMPNMKAHSNHIQLWQCAKPAERKRSPSTPTYCQHISLQQTKMMNWNKETFSLQKHCAPSRYQTADLTERWVHLQSSSVLTTKKAPFSLFIVFPELSTDIMSKAH